MEVDLVTLWAEETLIEVNLILDILFLAYYENFCTCKSEQWKRLCLLFKGILSESLSIGKLVISTEAGNSLHHAKVQLLLILIETLDLDNLLLLVHDEVPFREHHSTFSLVDMQDMDAIVSSFNALETVEAGPLILAWAVFLCLMLSLPEKGDHNPLMEIDHVAYVRQAFEAAPLNYITKILHNDISRESDSPVAGYRSVLRTLISAFVASYEMTQQTEDTTFTQILDILCKIYSGEESLCMQFWDKDSFVDGPIRSLVCSLESEFPFRIIELVRLLSALCEGTWPAECVYNFLDKMVGISSLFEISGDSVVSNISQMVETRHPLHVPGFEGLLIPGQTRGRVLKIVDSNISLIRWECMQSGIYVLLLRLAREFHLNSYEEVFVTLDLLCRMVSSNTALCFPFMHIDSSLTVQVAQKNGYMDSNIRVDVVKILCTLATNMSPNISNIGLMSMCIRILSKMLKCSPSHVAAVASRAHMFDLGTNGSSNGMWLLSGGLARMVLVDCEQNEECCSLTISVLDFTLQLVETGAEDNMLSALLVFSLQYVLVNHEHWKYKLKHARWQVTLKVLEVMKKCIKLIKGSQKLGCLIWDVLLSDSSIHDTLFRVMCVRTETLERMFVSRLFDIKEIEGLQLAICSVLDIVFAILNISKDFPCGLPTFHQAMLSSTTKPIPVVTALISLISFYRNSAIQVAAARVFSMLCSVAEKAQPYSFGGACLVSDDIQVRSLNASICDIIYIETERKEDLFLAIVQILTSAACHQPSLLLSLISTKETRALQVSNNSNVKHKLLKVDPFRSLRSKEASIVDSLLQHVKRSKDLIERHPHLLLSVLNFLKVLWQGATRYIQVLEMLKTSEKFWAHLSSFILALAVKKSCSTDSLEDVETLRLAHRYQCQSAVLQIIANEIFLQKRMSQQEIPEKKSSELSGGKIGSTPGGEDAKSDSLSELQDILSTWSEHSVLENQIKLFSSCGFNKDIVLRAKLSVSLCIVHVMGKLSIGDAGTVSLSLVEKINRISEKLREQPAFSELLAQYSVRGYSEGKELNALVLSDLYFHLQGELEGREMTPGPFRELSQFLLHLEIFQTSEQKNVMDFSHPSNVVYLFDPVRVKEDLGLDFWDHSGWKSSKAIGERMLLHMQDANLMAFLADSKHSALKALTSFLSLYEGNLNTRRTTSPGGMDKTPVESCINYLCKCLQLTSESLVPSPDPSEAILNCLATQAELLLNLIRVLFRQVSRNRQMCLPICALVLKTLGFGLRMLCDIRPSTVLVRKPVVLFLTLLLTSVEFSYPKLHAQEKSDSDVSDSVSDMSLVSLGLLPVLCQCVETAEFCNLSLAAVDILLKGFLTSNTWLPILQKHLQLPLVLWKLQQNDSHASVLIILKFLLTLARFRGGAEMLQTFSFFSSLKALLNRLLDDSPPNNQDGSGIFAAPKKEEKPHGIWGLTMAIVTAMINSLGEDSFCADFMDSVIRYFFFEKAYLIYYYLSAPEFPIDGHKKRARSQKSQTSLTVLRETEYTLMFICVLAKHHRKWSKAMKDVDSGLREMSIHLLAFISRGAQRVSESPSGTVPLLCPPILKEEKDFNSKPPYVHSKHGWFTLSARGCVSKASIPTVSTTALSIISKDRADGNNDLVCRTYFSDVVAIQIYKISFLVLKFLCLQAKVAAKRAEEVGFIDLAHFPELPMPDILHGLQDQAITIVIELCETSKLKLLEPEIQDLCVLLLQIAEKALYLELCVSQTCGIRPVLGRVEDFSKEIKELIQVAEEHASMKASLKSLKHIAALLYPGLLQTEGFM
eukprot:TRINITY_DN35516_c0_g1_i1.p1 TRINITY_DN35516_c0_g1~~TRINITY_DN35516_c0_g1_i1.p1  ORF type:complete len:2020 (+),score=353.46 TRINITY_DN35516_c0_g1_i1:707-6061(+)